MTATTNSALVKALDATAFALFPVAVNRKCKQGRVSGLEKFRPALVQGRDLIAEGIKNRHPVEKR